MEKLTHKQENQTSSVDKDLINIYSHADGSMEDVSRLDIKKRNPIKIIVLLFLVFILFLSGISWLGYLVYSRENQYSGRSFDITINAKKEISSGDEVTYQIEYTNKEKVKLLQTELIVKYPEGFTYVSSEPISSNQYNNIWKLDDLQPGQQGSVKIFGKVVGELGSIKTLEATLTFQPENFSSSFKETESFTSQITTSLLNITIDGPGQVLPEKKVEYTIHYENTSDKDLSDVQLVVFYPENFIVQSLEPIPEATPSKTENTQPLKENQESQKKNIWNIPISESKEKRDIVIMGGFVSSDKKEKEYILKAQIGFIDSKGMYALQLERSVVTKIINENLRLDIFIDGSGDGSTVNFGDTIPYRIVYKNLGQETLQDVKISAILESDILDWESLTDKNLGKVEKNIITWDTESISSLSKILPLDEGSIEFLIKVKNLDSVDVKKSSNEITSRAEAFISNINDMESGTKVSSNNIISSINTALDLKVEGRYFDDDNIAVGSGPLPPVVGQKTTYRIFWALSNNIHEVSNIIITTSLPPGVDWADKFLLTTGRLEYNPNDRMVTWKISGIPANKTFEEINAWFDISITPTKENLGKLLLLSTETNLEATDKKTEAKIIQLKRSITSNLEDDPFGGGRGVVVDIE